MFDRLRCLFFVVPLLLAATSCDSLFSPEQATGVENNRLTVVRVDPDAPPLEQASVTFWLVRGQPTEVEIRYLLQDGYDGKCLRLVIPAEAPLRHADGRMIAAGDSVQVTVRVIDPALFLFEIDPAGVQLNPAHPARLEIRYRWIAQDTDGDGLVNERDNALSNRFRLWAQDPESQLWSAVPSAARFSDIQEIHAPITTFTRYALASD